MKLVFSQRTLHPDRRGGAASACASGRPAGQAANNQSYFDPTRHTAMSRSPFVVLLAEDNEHDIVVIKRAWQEMVGAYLYIVSDGEACVDYLYQRGPYSAPSAAPRPGLLIL